MKSSFTTASEDDIGHPWASPEGRGITPMHGSIFIIFLRPRRGLGDEGCHPKSNHTDAVSATHRGEIHCTKTNFNVLLYSHAIKFK